MNWQKIVLHHSASHTKDKNGKLIDAKMIRSWHLAKGWHDIGYHYVVLADGSVQAGRPLTERGAHCLAANRNNLAIGICFVGNFMEMAMPEKQLQAGAKLVRQLLQQYHIAAKDVELHREVPGVQTLCPGKLFPAAKIRSY